MFFFIQLKIQYLLSLFLFISLNLASSQYHFLKLYFIIFFLLILSNLLYFFLGLQSHFLLLSNRIKFITFLSLYFQLTFYMLLFPIDRYSINLIANLSFFQMTKFIYLFNLFATLIFQLQPLELPFNCSLYSILF